ncbi:MAG: protoheme IX farnesyltransferase [Bacteroidales bacterium]
MSNNGNRQTFSRLVLSLGKVTISFSVALTTLTGFLAAGGGFSLKLLAAAGGVFILASGASALNQVQEHLTDALMARTRYRPLPAGYMSRRTGFILALVMILIGALILWMSTPLSSLILALLTVFWYNGVYTPLKKITAFAVFPGALVGARPPMIGWTAAGGDLWAVGNISIAFFFFMAQMPHFWIISLRSGEDYKRAGFPVVTSYFTETQLLRLTLFWTGCTVLSSLALPMGGIFNDPVSLTILVLSGIFFFSLLARVLVFKPGSKALTYSFILLSSYVLFVMIFISTWAILQ